MTGWPGRKSDVGTDSDSIRSSSFKVFPSSVPTLSEINFRMEKFLSTPLSSLLSNGPFHADCWEGSSSAPRVTSLFAPTPSTPVRPTNRIEARVTAHGGERRSRRISIRDALCQSLPLIRNDDVRPDFYAMYKRKTTEHARTMPRNTTKT
ncbi:hypothetical protein BDM02DRAFT_1886097 [Thelephora ganbajun]|uniref:Uncharacterized protein n=1 Tax=Thelephora ganbajun TaxID=370292 RepID=A0ACB6ZUI4_THEGA|nr:hypothetical protein BDM02DRAFT_1886097 [Thelephora ganbajun]